MSDVLSPALDDRAKTAETLGICDLRRRGSAYRQNARGNHCFMQQKARPGCIGKRQRRATDSPSVSSKVASTPSSEVPLIRPMTLKTSGTVLSTRQSFRPLRVRRRTAQGITA